jgi:hypothetical protein
MSSTIQLDHTHCGAICEQVGYRLRRHLDNEVSEVSPRVSALLELLRRQDTEQASSLSRQIDERAWR